MRATGHRTPGSWDNDKVPADKEDHPVVNVSWDDGMAYCRQRDAPGVVRGCLQRQYKERPLRLPQLVHPGLPWRALRGSGGGVPCEASRRHAVSAGHPAERREAIPLISARLVGLRSRPAGGWGVHLSGRLRMGREAPSPERSEPPPRRTPGIGHPQRRAAPRLPRSLKPGFECTVPPRLDLTIRRG